MTIVISIFIMLFILSILVVVHEFGHYIMARLFGVRVEEFSIFMGPKIFSKISKKTGTKWSLRWLPIGGYCALEGEEETVKSTTSLDSKPWYARTIIFLGGALMNFILAILIVVTLFSFLGYDTNEISHVEKGDYIAYKLGIEEGDRLHSYNGKRIYNLTDYYLFDYIEKKDTTSLLKIKKKDGSIEEYSVNRYQEDGEKSLLGITFAHKKGGFFGIIGNSITYLYSLVRSIFYSIFWLITGQLGLDAVASPIGMTGAVNDVVKVSVSWKYKILVLLEMSALISVNLGVFNLLIVPGLDGGRIFLILIELLRGGKKLSPETEAKISYIGLGLLLILALFVMGNDIIKLFK